MDSIKFQNVSRPILGLYLIAIPMFVVSAIYIYQIQFNGYVPALKKGYVVYFTIWFSVMIGMLFYIADKQARKRELNIDSQGLLFGNRETPTIVHWTNIKKITLDDSLQVIFIETISRANPLEDKELPMKYSSYGITSEYLWSLLEPISNDFSFKIEWI